MKNFSKIIKRIKKLKASSLKIYVSGRLDQQKEKDIHNTHIRSKLYYELLHNVLENLDQRDNSLEKHLTKPDSKISRTLKHTRLVCIYKLTSINK